MRRAVSTKRRTRLPSITPPAPVAPSVPATAVGQRATQLQSESQRLSSQVQQHGASLQELRILNEVIASNSTAALAFDNPDDARGVLAAWEGTFFGAGLAWGMTRRPR